MSMLSKVFVVINFLIAVSFMLATLTLYAKKVNWVDEARKNVDARNKLKDALDKKNTEYSRDIAAREAVIEKLNQDKTRVTAENGEMRGQISQLTAANSELRESYNRLTAELGNLRKNLSEFKEKNDRLQDEIDKMRNERDKAVSAREFAETQAIEVMADLKEAEAELLELSKRNHLLVQDVMEKDILIGEAVKRGFDPKLVAAAGMTSAKSIAGLVLQVEEPVNLVILNVGEKNDVKPGVEFVVSRGDKYIGKVRVRNVYPDMCSAVILTDLTKAPIQVADSAATR